MRRRTFWIGLGVLATLWLAPALFVGLYDPRVPRAPGAVESALEPGTSAFFLLSHGYAKHWRVETWQGEDETMADKTRENYYVERGPLNRREGTFQFRLVCSVDHASDLEAVRLFVTSAGDWSARDDGVWTQVAEALVEQRGAAEVTLACEAVVPASTTAYRLQEVRAGLATGGFSQSMLTAPTAQGRVYDTIAWLPFFRWVPDLR